MVLLKPKKICCLCFYCTKVHIKELPKPLGKLFCNVFNEPHFQYVLVACCLYSNENVKLKVETLYNIHILVLKNFLDKHWLFIYQKFESRVYHIDTKMLMTYRHLIQKIKKIWKNIQKIIIKTLKNKIAHYINVFIKNSKPQ